MPYTDYANVLWEQIKLIWKFDILKIYNLSIPRCTKYQASSSGEIWKVPSSGVPKNEKLSTKQPLALLLILFWDPFRLFPLLSFQNSGLSFCNQNTPLEKESFPEISLFIFPAPAIFLFWRQGKGKQLTLLTSVSEAKRRDLLLPQT